MTAERNKRRRGKLFIARGPILVRCKIQPTQKSLSYLYFLKTKSAENNVSDLFGYTGPNCKATNVSALYVLIKLLSTAFKH